MLRAWKRVIPGWGVKSKLKADVCSRKQDLRGTGHPSLPDTKFFVFQTFSVKENCSPDFSYKPFLTHWRERWVTAAAWVDATNWIRERWSWKHPCLELVLIEFCCLTPRWQIHSPNWALVHWCSVHVLLPRASVNPRLHCLWYCGWGCQGLLQQQFVAMLLPTGSLGTSRHSLVSQITWCPPTSPADETPALLHCILWTGQPAAEKQCFVWWEKVLIILSF